jgi:hypothetical protein
VASQGATTFSSAIQHLPPVVQDYLDVAIGTLNSAYSQLPEPAQKYLRDAAEISHINTPAGIAGTSLILIATLLSMSSWGRSFWGGGRSPFSTRSAGPPIVSEDDFSYITSRDIEQEPATVYEPSRRPNPAVEEDDVLLLKHRGITYPLKFPAYDIGDGKLYVADLRSAAQRTLGAKNRPIKLMYKGKLLKDDKKLCRDYGLKDKSEIFCTVGDQEIVGSEEDDVSESGTIGSKDSKKKRKGKKKSGKTKKSKKDANPVSPTISSTGGSRTETPVNSGSQAMIKLQELSTKLHRELLPECVKYTASPPVDAKKRDFDHKRLSETLLAQILLKADGVEVDGDPDARQFRKDLVKQTQDILRGLDAAAGVESQG